MPGQVQISSQSHASSLIVVDLGVGEGDGWRVSDVNTTSLPKHIPQEKVPGNYLQGGVEGMFRVGFKFRCNLTSCQIWEIRRQFQETSRNGRWKNVPGKVQISCQSHESSLIVVDLGVDEVDEGDSCAIDVNTTSLPKRIPQKKVLGNFPQRGDGRTFQERLQSRADLTDA